MLSAETTRLTRSSLFASSMWMNVADRGIGITSLEYSWFTEVRQSDDS